MKSRGTIFYLILFFLIFLSCHREDQEPSLPAGTLLKTEQVASYDTAYIRLIINGIGNIEPVTLRYGVTAWKVVYLTTDPGGRVVPASGLLVIPGGEGSFPLLTLQHGTVSRRTNVASEDPLLNEGVVALITGTEGYVTLIPDYLGLGVSHEMHPYLIRDVLAGNVIDMIVAVRGYIREQGLTDDGDLFLAGYSEGGYVTLAAHRALETLSPLEGMQVVASAPMAGSYDLKLTVDTILSYGVYNSPAFIAYTLCAYDRYYHWNKMRTIFRDPYGSLIPGLFDGTHTTGDINGRLPVEIDQLLQADFLDAYHTGNVPWLLDVLRENSLLDWRPSSYVRFYHGDHDRTVPYWNSVKALQELRRQGGEHVTLVTVAGGNHDSSVIPSYTGAIHWFDSLRTAAGR